MSSYIVKYSTLSRVASYVAYKRRIDIYDLQNKLTPEFTKLINDLWNMNINALSGRYGKKEKTLYKEYLEKFIFQLEPSPDKYTRDVKLLMKYFKSFSNYLYQCSEADIPETKLYKEIFEYKGDLGIQVAQNIPEWNEGEWE